MFHTMLLFVGVQLVCCDVKESARLVGVDAIHDTSVNINKDTVITRNLKLKNRNNEKTLDTEESPPDWSYHAIPHEMNSYVQQFKRNMSECLKEVQQMDTRPVKRLSPRPESPVHGECLIACVLKRNGVIQKGKINKDNLLALVSKFFAKDTKLMKKLYKHVDRCVEISARHEDECDLAAKLNACTNDLMAYNKHTITVNY